MSDGENKGVLDTRDAYDLARDMHMDLIEVAPTANPPVCRIMDYGKFMYEKEKKDRAAKKSQTSVEIKGVQLRPKTTEHHLGFKIRSARRFLESGNKVKVTLRFKGREMAHLHVARGMLQKVVEATSDLAYVETMPNIEGRTMLLIMAPSQATLAAAHLRATRIVLTESARSTRPQGTTRKRSRRKRQPLSKMTTMTTRPKLRLRLRQSMRLRPKRRRRNASRSAGASWRKSAQMSSLVCRKRPAMPG